MDLLSANAKQSSNAGIYISGGHGEFASQHGVSISTKIDHEVLHELTEAYLKTLISEVSGSLSADMDSAAPFGELGIDSFYVLKIIRRLEADFGTLPKTLLFQNFNVHDLAGYFVSQHQQTLCRKFARELRRADSASAGADDSGGLAAEVAAEPVADSPNRNPGGPGAAESIRILEKDALADPELRDVVHALFERYKREGNVSRGTRKIAPNLFIGSEKQGYFNYARCKNIILVYAYTGPRDYLPALTSQIYQYCVRKDFQLNFLADEEVPSIGEIRLTATPFGAIQRILDLTHFNLEGGPMRRLRYQVSKFQKSGVCRTEAYRCGANPQTDLEIAGIIDKWCAARTMVNPLVHEVRAEILAGSLPLEHRVFLTYLDESLQNLIVITPMSRDENGYLMDVEFYPPEMVMGALEFGIVRIIEALAAEGCDVLSLGGTYGCKLGPCNSADPEIDKMLDDLREQGVFNDQGNFQFKNKFRPENRPIFLCRPEGTGSPDSVIEIIMMIADPDRTQTPESENFNWPPRTHVITMRNKPTNAAGSLQPEAAEGMHSVRSGNDSARLLSQYCFDPLNIPSADVEVDLKTDSWAQLEMPAIEAQMEHLHAQLQKPISVDETVKGVFPFSNFILTPSGQDAEHVFFKAWPKKGIVLQNLLFPSTIFHEIDQDFLPKELPQAATFQVNSQELYKGNLAWDDLRTELESNYAAVAFACIELGNNAAGGNPVSLQHLKAVKALLAEYSLPLVVDCTRILENARLLVEREAAYAAEDMWGVVREVLSCADAVIGSLTKDFGVIRGGIVATNDSKLFARIQEVAREDGAEIDLIDRKLIALSLQNRTQIESGVLRRMRAVQRIWRALSAHNIPTVKPVGGHCILIDVKQIPEFAGFKEPVASFLAWIYGNTGIRAAAHSVGMQRHTSINHLVRLAIPIGLSDELVEKVIERLVLAFEKKVNIPEVALKSKVPRPLGGVYAKFNLKEFHNPSPEGRTGSAHEGRITPESGKGADGTECATEAAGSQANLGGAAGDRPIEGGERRGVPCETQGLPVGRITQAPRPGVIAIVGVAGRYPKARNIEELWKNLSQGRDCIEEIPPERYEERLQYGRAQRFRGGFIEGVERFDSLFFNISPREAEMLDPQERLFLEVAWETLEDAGYYPEILSEEDGSRNIGVYVGAVWAMYQMLGVEERYAGNNIAPNSFLWSIANRVSYWMNLSGPSLTVDTACSSSLTALYLACEAISAGECSGAIVGGVNLDLHPTKLEISQSGGALSPDGVCRSFGKGANGYVAGEGVGALFLKPLDRAIHAGDHIYGVIKSVVVNHGGRTSGYTVPNPKAQEKLISTALDKSGIDARTIGYVEAHGTGTALGDPIEITGLSDSFSTQRVGRQSCAIGSIKSNIGHLEAAAGVAGITKVLLQMKHRTLVPSLHSSELNEFIDFRNSPFYVVQSQEEWKARQVDGVQIPLRAGLSSFGAGGSNAHVILESYEAEEQGKAATEQGREFAFPLSARSNDQLREAARRLAEFLPHSAARLEDVAHTLQVGRKPFDYRVVILAATREDLVEKLGYVAAGREGEGIVTGYAKSTEGFTRLLSRTERKELGRLLLQRRDPGKLGELWVEGLLPDWSGLLGNGKAQRVSLPTYPFADKRHWAGPRSSSRQKMLLSGALHPLIDSNASTFDRQIFRKTFHDGDFFIYDHVVAGIPTLPGVAYLELARKAGELAAGREVRKIRNIVWVAPIAVQNSVPQEVSIELKPSEATVRFEVFSQNERSDKVLHAQGTLVYAGAGESAPASEYIDLESVRARCARVADGASAYPLFKSSGLELGPSFQVLQEVYKNEHETLGSLKLPEQRHGDLQSMVLQPSMVDGSLQAGVAAQIGQGRGEMFVPFSIGEVEILHPLQSDCFSYVTEEKEDRKGSQEKSRVVRTNVVITDQMGKVLVRIHDSIGVPLRELYAKPVQKKLPDGFSQLYYSYDWERAPLVSEDVARPGPQSILLFDNGESMRDVFRTRLKINGTDSPSVILVRQGDRFEEVDRHYFKINPENRDDFTRLFSNLVEGHTIPELVCFAWPTSEVDLLDRLSLQQALRCGVYAFLSVCQALIQHKLEGTVQAFYMYCGDGKAQPHNNAVRGFVNTLHLECPRQVCKIIEVTPGKKRDEAIFEAVEAEFKSSAREVAAVRYEGQERFVKRLKAFGFDDGPERAPLEHTAVKSEGVCLITGGAGGLGLIFAEFLARVYMARVVLTGRSELTAERIQKLEELKSRGFEVVYLTADVCSEEDVNRVVREIKARFGEINGVIHAAGLVRDSLIGDKTPAEMEAVLAPKVYGTILLDKATKEEKLDFFVTFSSLSAVTGNPGQCDYSFANHFMDSFAEWREQRRAVGSRFGKTLSVNWSLWADGGMKLDTATERYFKETLGIRGLSTATGLDAFVKGLSCEMSHFAVLEGVQEKVEVAWGLKTRKSNLPVPAPSSGEAVEPAAGDENRGELAGQLQSDLSQIVMSLLKLDAGEIEVDKLLLDMGFDSVGLTTFANAINEKYQLDITPVLFFDYSSLGEITRYLTTERKEEIVRYYGGAGRNGSAAATTPGSQARSEQPIKAGKGWNPAQLDRAPSPLSSVSGGGLSAEFRFLEMPIAIVGMSGVMPQSEDLEEFWDNLSNSRDLIRVIPPDRWRWEDFYGDPLKEPNKSNSKWGGFMREVDKFDPLFFGISPREAQMMDPQQRIFLQTVWKAIEDSGHKVSDLSGTRTGLFVGVATNDYLDLMNGKHAVLDGYSAAGNSHSILANRVSFLLNLRGPSAPIDTACSSSLVALHRAIESIHSGSCDMAIVGGVQVMLGPAAHISFSAAGMLSPDGRCKAFDKRANGYVRGEGCGAVLLKPLSVAEADGDRIYAVIKSTVENHGGRVSTMTAPNSSAQAALLIEAYEKAHVDLETVGYIECHGTGTSLGDPIEIQALTAAFAELYKRRNKSPAQVPHCGLSSVKTNIGHLETAAGIAALLKVLLALQHKQIPANIHFEEMNPYINLKGTPFYIADKLTEWKPGQAGDGTQQPRRAGVSSFGFGGANAHIVLEEYIPRKGPAERAAGPQLIVLSAKNGERLRAYVQAVHLYLEKGGVELVDLAYTLQVGRDEMAERLALVAESAEELQAKLAAILKGTEAPQGCWQGGVRSRENKGGRTDEDQRRAISGLMAERKLAKLAELWVSGAKVDWSRLHVGALPTRISAPTYPFAKERHWIPDPEQEVSSPNGDGGMLQAAYLHPLVHRNISTLQEQKFASRFSGREFYLADHVLDGQKILPGVAYLEIARAAGELSANSRVRSIRNLTWERPFVVNTEGAELQVTLTPTKGQIAVCIKSLDKDPVIYCRGQLGYSSQPANETVDLDGIRARCSQQVVSGDELYPSLRGVGLDLGPGFQIVQSIFANQSESLAVLRLPEQLRKEADEFVLHPALMDGSLHTAIGLMKANGLDLPLAIPYSVGEVQIFDSLRDLSYGYATWAVENPWANQKSLKVSFALLDRNGRVLVRIKDYVSRPPRPVSGGRKLNANESKDVRIEETDPGLKLLIPVWNRVGAPEIETTATAEPGVVLLLGANQSQLQWVQQSFGEAQCARLMPPRSIESIEAELGETKFDQLLWIAPDAVDDADTPGDGGDDIVARQVDGVLTVFRIIKALLHLGYAEKKLRWTFVTCRTQHVTKRDRLQPVHAGVIGLVGSLAKEHPHWSIRLLDVESLASVSARECLSLPFERQGNPIAHRQGEWHRPELALKSGVFQGAPPYRENGVYVVIGGAGGLGEVWSRHLIERYHARLVWIGRRKCDSAIEKKIGDLGRVGFPPLYIAADAANREQLDQAVQTIRKTFPRINGVVHSAMVLQDQSLARMEEQAFRASLCAKVDVSVNIDRVFGAEDLDFMLFFSSFISFFKSPGQANYAAGCTFKDSFARSLQQRHTCTVRTMNWGYWGTIGAVADDSYRKFMAQMGIGSIEPEEGMTALDELLGSGLPQLALIKTLNPQATASLGVAEAITCFPECESAAKLEQVVVTTPLPALEDELPHEDVDALVTDILTASLGSAGLFNKGGRNLADVPVVKHRPEYYERWLNGSIRYLQRRKVLGPDATPLHDVRSFPELWDAWEQKRPEYENIPTLKAQIALLEACLRALPAILTGSQSATEVLFPGSSMHLVEGIYRGSPVADYFNEVLAEVLAQCVAQKVQADNEWKCRIVEIGAGTGGTTAKLLTVLAGLPVSEYCYTDLSKAFLMYAEKAFKPHFPVLSTAILDISKPLEVQSLDGNCYDFAIAANVLHATPDIRETLRNAKALLKKNGILLLNEISTWSLFTHLTFGLLEGWWLQKDSSVRLSDSPGLPPQKWQELLEEEGFEAVIFPARSAHSMGQQIVAARSDGWVRRHIFSRGLPLAAPSAPDGGIEKLESNSKDKSRTAAGSLSGAARESQDMSNDRVRQVILDTLCDALRIDAGMIRNDAPFADYGVDSIIGVKFARTISERLQIELEATKLFEYSTVDDLTGYICSNWQEQLRQLSSRPARIETAEAWEAKPEFASASEPRFIEGTQPVDAGDARTAGIVPIAIIGMSGRFAQSESLDQLWLNLKEGRNLVSEVSRWSKAECAGTEKAGSKYCSHGSFIDAIDHFDPAFFGISQVEATYMDPQQRLLLEESWKAMEDAGYAGASVREKRCGVYMGCGTSNYERLFADVPPPQAWWGNSQSVAPARIAYYLNLQGPAIAVDTACSSSLVAIHLACQGLWAGETEMGLAGGVYLQATAGFHQVANRAGMLSPDGMCYSFDARANGFVPGEGVGVVVLKRLPDALRDGDYIHAVIAGSGINQNGGSNGLIAPNARAQERLEREVYERFQINPESIQLVEAHGTGTPMGDSIEVGAITRVFREYTDKRHFCSLGSVKTNLGHGATAAGITAVLKVVLSLKHRQIPPLLNFEHANPAMDFAAGPFYVNTRLQDWEVDGERRRAAVSSFGFSGTNAHLILEEAPSIETRVVESPGYAVVLSARTTDQLKHQTRNLISHVEGRAGVSMNDLSFSLLVGRTHHSHRLSCVARNSDELTKSLAEWLETGQCNRIYASEIQDGHIHDHISLKRFGNHCIHECSESADSDVYLENLATIADLFVQGYALDYHSLFAPGSRRVPLPTYPFARESYWVKSNNKDTKTNTEFRSVAPAEEPTVSKSQEWMESGAIRIGDNRDLVGRLRDDLAGIVAEILKLDARNVASNRMLLDMGFDSVGLTTFANAINEKYQLDITPVLFFDYPSLGEIARYLTTERKEEIVRCESLVLEGILEKVTL